MAIKQYFGNFGGRIAGIPNWKGGPFVTANKRIQTRIENHPLFLAGHIQVVNKDIPGKPDTADPPVDYEAYVKGLKWNELRDLAKDKGIALFGKKAVDLIEELLALEE